MSSKRRDTSARNPSKPSKALKQGTAGNFGIMGHEHDDTLELEENRAASSQEHSDDDERAIDSGEDRGDDAGVLEQR